jgi:hypothetical protein
MGGASFLSGSGELLALRLGLLAILFLFVFVAAWYLRSGLRPRAAATRRAAGNSSAGLVVIRPGQSGLAQGTEIQLFGTTTVGRDDTAGIQIADASVSGNHAILERTANGWTIRDLQSTNGTAVGDRRVGDRGVLLRNGQEISFGIVRFKFRG